MRLCVIDDARKAIRTYGPGQDDLFAPRNAYGHAQGSCRRLQAVVGRHVHDIHFQKLPHHAAVLPEGLETPVIFVGLARIRGQEFAALVHFVADRRHVVLIATAAEEAEVLAAAVALVQDAFHVALQAKL
jgi:hypothetical protein